MATLGVGRRAWVTATAEADPSQTVRQAAAGAPKPMVSGSLAAIVFVNLRAELGSCRSVL